MKFEEIEIYECRICGREYDTVEEARECMGRHVIPSVRYICPICEERCEHPNCCTVDKIEAKLLRLKADVIANQSGRKLKGLEAMQEHMVDNLFNDLELLKKEATDDTCCVTAPREEELRAALSLAKSEERCNRERCMMGYYDMNTKEAALALATYLARRKND